MKKTKMEKGITLIALIITIVVLLILAIVTIGAIRNSKIITHSQDVSNEHIIGQEKEKIQLALGEWQIQKNIPENTQTFKEVIETELNGSATVSGEANGPLTITMKETQNKYNVTDAGITTSLGKVTALEKYIFGEELQGRDLAEIVDYKTGSNKEDLNLGINSGSMSFLNWCDTDDLRSEDGDIYYYYSIMYIKYNNVTYKFKLFDEVHEKDDDKDKHTSLPEYGLIKVYNAEEGTKVGKKVKFNNELWTILYDDNTNGLQIISDKLLGNTRFYLGANDSSIKNWNSLIAVADLDKNGTLSDLEKSIYSYNHAIETLNKTCENLFKESGEFINQYIESVRCVGSNPINKNDENNDLYTIKWPEKHSEQLNDVVKNKDENYISDYDRMVALGIMGVEKVYIDDEGEVAYWLASRINFEREGKLDFFIRGIDGFWNKNAELIYESQNKHDVLVNGYSALRPVIKLKSNVQFSGSGTSDEPYTFAE